MNNNPSESCFGWIENILGNILIDNPFKNCKQVNHHFEKDSNPYIDPNKFDPQYKELINSHLSFFRIKKTSDIKEESDLAIFIYFFDTSNDQTPKKIIIFHQDPEQDNFFVFMIEILIKTFDEKGFITLECVDYNSDYFDIKKYLLREAFININEIYGQHFNAFIGKYGGYGWNWEHEPIEPIYPDYINPVFYSNCEMTDDEAYEKLAIQHIKRIFTHLNRHNLIISKFGILKDGFEIAILFRRQTNGCLIFTRTFIQSYINIPQKLLQYQQGLENSSNIINAFSEEMQTIITVNLEHFIKDMIDLIISNENLSKKKLENLTKIFDLCDKNLKEFQQITYYLNFFYSEREEKNDQLKNKHRS
ncbi:hypothetical protein [uncultured Methanospirillum sp.]|uniref:hypothetical protein n=1 Tax=uncultured Methanospirillum sp. TaxID=262503 RepID=UPI0029C6479C|nr:hypothetical protein [uncultured Methanospirillum sp.]